MNKFRIRLNQFGLGEVWVDDKYLGDCCNLVSYSASVGINSPELTLGLIGDVEIEGEADIRFKLPNGKEFTVRS